MFVWRWLWRPDHQQWRWWLLERRICLSILSIDMMFATGGWIIYFSNTLFIFNECLLSAPYSLYCNVLIYSLVIFYLVYLKFFDWAASGNKFTLFQNCLVLKYMRSTLWRIVNNWYSWAFINFLCSGCIQFLQSKNII